MYDCHKTSKGEEREKKDVCMQKEINPKQKSRLKTFKKGIVSSNIFQR